MTSIIDLLRSGTVKKILVTSHRDPDVDAYSSSLLMYLTLQENFPEIEVSISIETDLIPKKLSFLNEIDKIRTNNLREMIIECSPDILILTDASEMKLLTKDKELTIEYLRSVGITVAALDHHDSLGTGFNFYTNEKRLSCVEVIYFDFIQANNLKLPEEWQNLVLSGLLSDSDRFYFESPKVSDSYKLVSEIVSQGYSIREMTERLETYSPEQYKILSKLLDNIIIDKERRYGYSYLTDDDRDNLIIGKMSQYEFMDIRRLFIDRFLNALEGIDFVFSLRKPIDFNGRYSGSIRAKRNTINCLVLLKYLDGGGYIDGGGFSVETDSLDKAIEKVKDVIELHRGEAYSARVKTI